MNVDKKLSGELDRFFLSTLLETISELTPNGKLSTKESIVEMMKLQDISSLNNFLARRSYNLTPQIWDKLSPDSFGDLKNVIYKGQTPKDFLEAFNSSAKLRYMLLPFSIAISDESDEAKLFRIIAELSIKTINELWDGTGGAIDVEYWTKLIELFPWRLIIDCKYFTSLCYEENIVQQMIEELGSQTTSIKDIPREMLVELMEVESYIYKHGKKHPTPRGTSSDLIKEMKKRETSLMRLKMFADCSGFFRLYSIRAVDIHLYTLLYCLPAEKQLKAQDAIADVTTICEKMGTTPRKPNMGETTKEERQP